MSGKSGRRLPGRRGRVRASWRRTPCAGAAARSRPRRARPQQRRAARALDAADPAGAIGAWVAVPGATGRRAVVEQSQVGSSSAAAELEAGGDVAGGACRGARARRPRTRAAGCRRGRRAHAGCARGRGRPRRDVGVRARRARRRRRAAPGPSRRIRAPPGRRGVGAQARTSARASAAAARWSSANDAVADGDRAEEEPVAARARSLIRCARSFSAANAIVPGAKPTPAQSAPMSWRWL